VAKVKPEQTQATLQKFTDAASYATDVLNQLFGYDLEVPKIELLAEDYRNAYWDGEKIRVPAPVQDLPDITYHEVAWPFVQKAWKFQYTGQSGALVVSYTDILTSFVKQQKLHQSAADADWQIAPGAIAWITGNLSAIATDKRPLRSLKNPGTAYDDKTIGRDEQPSHMRNFVKTGDDSGGIHLNSGIPNKAFYEAAVRIGTEKAVAIWIKSLPRFSPTIDLAKAAKEIYATAKSTYGATSPEAEAVKAAWESVGLAPQ
jgi:Zn-dependent metalloprotease